jgi:hypothetical protein
MAVKMFWSVTTYGLFSLEDGDSMFLRTLVISLLVHTALQRRITSSMLRDITTLTLRM